MSYKVYNKELKNMECIAKLKVGGTYMFEKEEAEKIASAMEGATYNETLDCFTCANGERIFGVDACSRQKKFFHVYPMGHVEDWEFEKKIEDSLDRKALLKYFEERRKQIIKEIDNINSKDGALIVLGAVDELSIMARYFGFFELSEFLDEDDEYVRRRYL